MPQRVLPLLLLGLALPSPAAEPQVAAALLAERPTLDFGVGYRGFARTFGLDSGSTSLPRYAGTGASVAVEAGLFPFASVTTSAWGNLGLVGEGHFSFGLLASRLGHDYAAEAITLRGGLALRVPFGASEVLLHAGVGYQSFQLATTSTDNAGALLTQADPGFLGPRSGIAYRLRVTERLALQARAAFLITLSRGQLDQRFPRATAFGLDAGLQVALMLVPGVQLRLSGDWSRVFLSLDGGLPATEQQFGGTLSVAVAL
jgi:hypothetical protein